MRYWAAAREAAGVPEERVDASGVDAALAEAVARHGDRLERVLRIASLLVDGRRVQRTDPLALTAGSVVEVLPPFAGG
ncbi:molybdopterin converting factor small subunit [Motilibacter rhizosphaerae]|uniref:Molybdopterin converting factor small subunit n=1 Tax=Motilibacter rhizosphaerae TaxID=598652 RepID=A0A4Q7NV85_9ACTN|nr:molybdopterin converting factor small subunit [Motilibacter rhizosphaerae]